MCMNYKTEDKHQAAWALKHCQEQRRSRNPPSPQTQPSSDGGDHGCVKHLIGVPSTWDGLQVNTFFWRSQEPGWSSSSTSLNSFLPSNINHSGSKCELAASFPISASPKASSLTQGCGLQPGPGSPAGVWHEPAPSGQSTQLPGTLQSLRGISSRWWTSRLNKGCMKNKPSLHRFSIYSSNWDDEPKMLASPRRCQNKMNISDCFLHLDCVCTEN